MVNQYYPNNEKIYVISILKRKDYKTVIKLLMQEKNSKFIFTSGNDINTYTSKEELYNEAKKYSSDNIYMCDLEKTIQDIQKYKNGVFFIVGSFYIYDTVIANCRHERK